MISLKLQHVTLISSPQAYLKEGTAIIQLVMFDDQIGCLIYLLFTSFETFVWIRIQ
jgi:hypothetical protein